MKRGISVKWDCDRTGEDVYIVQKQRGKLSLDEIRDAMIEIGCESYFALVLPCIDEDSSQYWDDDLPDDAVTLYDMAEFLKFKKRVREV